MKHLDIEWIPSALVVMTLTVVPPIIDSAEYLGRKPGVQQSRSAKGALTKVIVLAREQGKIRTVTNSTVNCSRTAA